MENDSTTALKNGEAPCLVIAGKHQRKWGTIRDMNTSKTGHVTLMVEQQNSVRFKTLMKML